MTMTMRDGATRPDGWMDGWMDAHEHEGGRGQKIVRVGESEAEIYVYANGNENEHRRRPRQRRAVSEQSTRWRMIVHGDQKPENITPNANNHTPKEKHESKEKERREKKRHASPQFERQTRAH